MGRVGIALALALLALVGVQARRRAPAAAPGRIQRGVALGLFASDPDWD